MYSQACISLFGDPVIPHDSILSFIDNISEAVWVIIQWNVLVNVTHQISRMVYLVEDDIDDQEITQAALIQNGYDGPVIMLQNGKALMDKLLEDPTAKPDVILLDLNLPLRDGFDVLAEIKRHPLFRTIPVIVLTASKKKADELRCLELGCNSFFTKPNSMQEYDSLVELVKRFTGKTTTW